MFIMQLDMRQMRCVGFKAHSLLMENNAVDEVIFLFNVVLEHVVFERPFPRPFVFGEPASMRMWHWIGIRANITA